MVGFPYLISPPPQNCEKTVASKRDHHFKGDDSRVNRFIIHGGITIIY